MRQNDPDFLFNWWGVKLQVRRTRGLFALGMFLTFLAAVLIWGHLPIETIAGIIARKW